MIRSRSAWLLIPVVAVALNVSGCSRKKMNPEVRTNFPKNELASGGANGANGGVGGSAWSPGGAPGADGGFSSPGMGLGADGSTSGTGMDSSSFATDASGSIPNGANTDNIESASAVSDLEMVHFDYDMADISPDWTTVLDHHAEWLNGNAAVSVQIEGHCDERGTEEYNLALGQRRADAVRTYLVDKGVDPNRLSTISYGKLRPLTFDQNDESHALNRRAMFLVYQPGDSTALAASN